MSRITVACKATNEYCKDLTVLSKYSILHSIRVKDGHDKFSRMKYEELMLQFKDTELLDKMYEIASIYYNPIRFHKILRLKRLLARYLRYHLRGLSDEQTLHKFGYEIQNDTNYSHGRRCNVR